MLSNSFSQIAFLIGVFLLCSVDAQSQSVTFNYTGNVQTWIVPPCVNSIQVFVAGAKGGGINGGNGVVLNSTLTVSSGQVLNIVVGGIGNQGNNSGGYNGGGTGYASSDGNINYASWGGGGASDIRIGGTALTNRIIVAGGGGGRSGGSSGVCGGAANCLDGAQGCSTFGTGALGGTQFAGGAGGTPWAGTPPGGSPGSLGTGGQAGYWQTASGGGGGGGYYGGGGGGNDGCCTGANGGGGGGGGSSLLPAGGICLGATNSGNGYVTITYTLGTGISSPTNTGPFCENSLIQLQSVIADSYSWTGPNGFVSNLQNPTIPNASLINAGNYTLTTTTLGCVATASTTVTVNPLPIVNAGPDLTICQNTPISLTAAGATSYSWNNGVSNGVPFIPQVGTMIYTVTGTSSGCAVTDQVTVTVSPETMPSFNSINPICAGEIITLPNSSINSINGSWSPTINNSATTTYTFTPNGGQCATTAIMTIAVNPNVTPTFIQVTPICIGDAFVLPTSSTNNINGSWSPSLNNSTTSTYTFLPDSGQCATTATMTVTVGLPTTPAFTQVSPVCAGTLFTLPITSNEGISGAWSPAVNSASTTTYTFTPTAGQCANSATMTVAVNQQITPTFPTYGPFCLNDVLAQVMLPETSNNGITGTWNPGMLSTDNSGITVYTFTPDNGQCASVFTSTVVVYDLPTIDLTSAVINNENCGQSDGSINGILLSGGGGSYQIEWNNSPQLNTLDLTNLAQGTYLLEVFDVNGCVSEATLTVQGNLPPVIDASGVEVIQPSCVVNGSIQGFVITGNQPLTYAWTSTSQTTSDISDLTPGSYGLTVTDAQGCSSSFGPVFLTAPIVPTASFTWSPQDPTENSQVVFTDNSNGSIVNYSWSINGQTFTGEQVEYTVVEGEYTIQLTVTDDNGCTDTYTITLNIFDGLTIPNVLTFNNDGVNDFLIIEGLMPQTSLTILNRWGEIVFSTNNYQNDWNGRDQNGTPLTEGVYAYLIRENDGNERHGFIHLFK
jgi:gliding motility-associated-like protein